jgi:hypothetical protein
MNKPPFRHANNQASSPPPPGFRPAGPFLFGTLFLLIAHCAHFLLNYSQFVCSKLDSKLEKSFFSKPCRCRCTALFVRIVRTCTELGTASPVLMRNGMRIARRRRRPEPGGGARRAHSPK